MRYQKSLDSFRAIAALAVVLYHCNAFPAGWIGVHAFFVLSGFLITTILLEARTGTFKQYIGNFYRRRALRILPLYYGFLLLLLVIYLLRNGHPVFDPGWLSLATYTFNWHPFRDVIGNQYLGHLWSLCVEEQFYLFWPFLVYFLSVKAFRRLAFALVLLGPLFRILTAVWIRHSLPHLIPGRGGLEDVAAGVYFATQSHLDAFALGAMFAAAPRSVRNWLEQRAAAVFAGCTFIMVAAAALNIVLYRHSATGGHFHGLMALGFIRKSPDFHQYIWVYTILNLMSFGALLLFLHVTRVRGLMENRLLIYLGKISYGIYVWHVPVVKLFEEYWPVRLFSKEWLVWTMAVVAVTILMATVSFYGFEKFFIDLKEQRQRPGAQKVR
jgi:peptidoglycan/LPS O-acetylase OafA/YrhL